MLTTICVIVFQISNSFYYLCIYQFTNIEAARTIDAKEVKEMKKKRQRHNAMFDIQSKDSMNVYF